MQSRFCAALALLAGLAIPTAMLHAIDPADKAPKTRNPLPKSHENLLAGAAVYREQCSGCHGPSGVPVRKFPRLERQPAVLTRPDIQHDPDSETFRVLTHGAPGGMPAFADDLSETERWQTAMFVHRLGKDADKYTAELPPEKK